MYVYIYTYITQPIPSTLVSWGWSSQIREEKNSTNPFRAPCRPPSGHWFSETRLAPKCPRHFCWDTESFKAVPGDVFLYVFIGYCAWCVCQPHSSPTKTNKTQGGGKSSKVGVTHLHMVLWHWVPQNPIEIYRNHIILCPLRTKHFLGFGTWKPSFHALPGP